MTTGKVTITAPNGMHARPAGELVKLIRGLAPARITLRTAAREASAVSILSLLALGLKHGTEVEVCAEVLLNYAEAKAELGEMDAAVWDQTIAQLRSRAGVTPVVPDKADPYMEAYFLNTVTDKWILEVRRERGIELCLEMGLRWDDDMRWHMGDLLTSDNNPWTGIWIGNTGYTYDFTGQSTDDNGDPVPDFYIRPGEDTEHSIAISNTGANQTFSLNAAGNIVWEYKRTWGEKKYLRPIPQTAITRNPNLEQNALWK